MPIEVRLINLLTRGKAAASFIAINEPSSKDSLIHKYTNTKIHENTNTRIHKQLIHKYKINKPSFKVSQLHAAKKKPAFTMLFEL